MRPSKSSNKIVSLFLMLAFFLMLMDNLVLAASMTQTSPMFNIPAQQTMSTVSVENMNQTDVTVSYNIITSVEWNPTASITVIYDDNFVRQGRHLGPKITYNNHGDGLLLVTWSMSNLKFSWSDSFGDHSIDGPDLSRSASGSAPLLPDDQARTYHLESGAYDILPELPDSPYVALSLAADVTISSKGIETLRHAEIGGNAVPSDSDLYLDPSDEYELFVPCNLGSGDDLVYSLGELTTNQDFTVTSYLVVDVGINAGLIPVPHDSISFATPTFELGSSSKSFNISAPGMSFNLGEVLPNNIPPTAVTEDEYFGSEGTAITFDGSLSKSVCGVIPTLKWEFSDGGVEYGAKPKHTFEAPGMFTGLLTATDMTGLTATKTFTIEVDNLKPTANAGPDMSTKWGIPVTLSGSGWNPGTYQQPMLDYAWDFGDGTPSASGGPKVNHVYDLPGTYDAELTVTDPGGLYDKDMASVVVQKRDTQIGYFGPLSSSSSQMIPLKAVLKDEFGIPLGGRLVEFTIWHETLGILQTATAKTDNNGVAIANLKLKIKAGNYWITTRWNPISGSMDDQKYTRCDTNNGFKVGKK